MSQHLMEYSIINVDIQHGTYNKWEMSECVTGLKAAAWLQTISVCSDSFSFSNCFEETISYYKSFFSLSFDYQQ